MYAKRAIASVCALQVKSALKYEFIAEFAYLKLNRARSRGEGERESEGEKEREREERERDTCRN